MKVAIVIIATGAYFDKYVVQLVQSIRQHWLVGTADTVPVVITDSADPVPEGCVKFHAPYLPWPQPTLKKYNMLMEHEGFLRAFDYVYIMDADMRIVAPVTDEILGDLVGAMRPCMDHFKPEECPWERDPRSLAYVPAGQEAEHYLSGSIAGGKREKFLAMAKTIAENVLIDEEYGIIARFHEESHLNKYFINHPPDKILSPEFVYPEKLTLRPRWTRRIILTLDHKPGGIA